MPMGAFGWYTGWNIVGIFLVLFSLPETEEKTLEELNAVFNVSLRKLARGPGPAESSFTSNDTRKVEN
ncbi:hypothetical protein CORC01_07042 [Colletotrichum orchidophilum]|uniref:Major facilitator superfamily (MFS) profile domain-containing protein n=1 Tax=Colletotrichum orchidophilum TaxID=1209926 RepID=A0A1G4B882_9PEZI|nr:uncharacterized protein CORC01_07042 [Colletotrichum orchidophilum]OHE97627.1 hypothetical protein CORC01_07042 [Colletotrichum orchidophilum]